MRSKAYYVIKVSHPGSTIVEVHYILYSRDRASVYVSRIKDTLLVDDTIMSYFMYDNDVRIDWSNVRKDEYGL